ncbi:GNAT family N-acetyltransferase [Halobacillus naozhouensis]|uniref:GNAT family N-acetyltransferase n=1 Tax=Halobacillus naozhouensis TaxID=554880 RepID=A0ABY8J0L7_9BACI|nr:GNAT family N-acetyltransferase [Halobacillus naozhouensis]WFT76033.1 GNAT family N-acetyltransferase [Halobacillus naozhouensis]
MKVREAMEDDAAAIARISVDTWRAAYQGLVPNSFLQQMSYGERTNKWKQKLADLNMKTYVAETEKGEVVGYANGGPIRGGGPEEAELYAIYIFPEYQGLGVGKQLISPLVNMFLQQNFKQMVVWMLEGNRAASFYESLGAAKFGHDTMKLAGKTLTLQGYRFKDLTELLAHVKQN